MIPFAVPFWAEAAAFWLHALIVAQSARRFSPARKGSA